MTAMELFPMKIPTKRGIANRRKYAVNFLSWISYKIMTSCKFLNLFFPHYYVKFLKLIIFYLTFSRKLNFKKRKFVIFPLNFQQFDGKLFSLAVMAWATFCPMN